MGETPEEDLIAWLERCEVPLDQQRNLGDFQKYLADELGITEDTQVSALWSVIDVSPTLAEHGIHAVTVTYPWGKELRYGIQGMPGLWGYASVQKIREEEDW